MSVSQTKFTLINKCRQLSGNCAVQTVHCELVSKRHLLQLQPELVVLPLL